MEFSRVIELMSEVKGRVRGRTLSAVQEILALATEYSYLGTKFTFDADKGLDRAVNAILIQLTDLVLEEADSRLKSTMEDDDDSGMILSFAHGQDIVRTTDAYSSHLKHLLEGYLAVCFAAGMTNADILGGFLTYISNPYIYPPMRKAFESYMEYRSALIQSRGFHFGRGVATNPIIGFELIAENIINGGYQFEIVKRYARNPNIIGYRVHRGSGYDCETCDEAVAHGIYPLTDIVLPLHPRCRCYTTPVYAGEVV